MLDEPFNQHYQNAGDIIDLAMEMQAKRHGMTLDDIKNKFACSRRKAERMRDALTVYREREEQSRERVFR